MHHMVHGAIALTALAEAYDVKTLNVTVGGYTCGEYKTAYLYLPDVSDWYVRLHGKFPLLAFAHGFNNPGTEAWHSYDGLLKPLAAEGYIVIVSTSSNFPLECPTEWRDQLRDLEWIRASKFASKIDFTKTGILGHSMGGGATYHLASNASAVKALSIGAAVMLHPQIKSPLPVQPYISPLVPAFYGTGSADIVVSPESVKSAYDKDTTPAPKVFTEIDGADHNEPMVQPWGKGRWTPYVIAMFDCHLKGWKHDDLNWHTGGCDKIYGSGSGSLCSGNDFELKACEFANWPQPGEVLV